MGHLRFYETFQMGLCAMYLPAPRADFWALAGIYAVDKTIENANSACDEDDCAVPASGLVFQWGREVTLSSTVTILVRPMSLPRTAPLPPTPPTMWVCQRPPSTTPVGRQLTLPLAAAIVVIDITGLISGVTDFFASEFGFDANETVALMGAHTLGRCTSCTELYYTALN